LSKRPLDPNLRRLFHATFLFGMACGISISLSSLHLDALAFSKQRIGALAATFAFGIVAGALPAGALVRRFSAKTTLVACLAGYAVCVTAFPFLRGLGAIGAVRFVDGACSVGIWVSSETILLSRTGAHDKAQLTSLYVIWLACGYVLGPAAAKIITLFASMPAAFVVAGGFAAAACALAWLRLPRDVSRADDLPDEPESESEPEPESQSQSNPGMPWKTILWRIKNSCFASFSYGYFQASVVVFLPLYLIEAKGIARDRTIILPGLFCFGMLLSANAAGRVADRIGHLLMMRALVFVGGLMVVAFIVLDDYLAMYAAVVVAGATLASMSPISLALQGVIVPPRDYSRSTSLYNVFYAAGMLIGPPASSAIFQRWSGGAMLLHLAGIWFAFVLFSIVFMYDDPAATRRVELVKSR
jgi:predicted MFS family arabinose efflux permease